jgi:antitoxin VapB
MNRNIDVNKEKRPIELDRTFGSVARSKTIDMQRHKTKIFKSGNSLAVRIPAGTDLSVGMEMELAVEHGQFLTYEPVNQPKQKFNIAKVAGSAKGLNYVEREDRSFDPRPSSDDEKIPDE